MLGALLLAACPPATVAAAQADDCAFVPPGFQVRSGDAVDFSPLGDRLTLPPRLRPTTSEVRFTLPPAATPCWLIVDRVSLYGMTIEIDGLPLQRFDFFRPVPPDRVAASGYAVPLPAHAAPRRVHLEITQLGVLSTDVRRVSEAALMQMERRIGGLHALSLLAPLIMAALMGLFWLRLRDRALAAYVGLLGSLILVTASLDGTLYFFAPGMLFAGLKSMAHIFLLSVFGFAVALFYREFLAPLDRSGERTFRLLAGAFAFTGMSSLLGIPVYSAIIQHVTTFSLLVAVPLLLWQGLRSLRARHPSAIYFLVGWSLPLLVIPLRLMAEYGLVEWNFWLRYAPRFGFMAEAMVFALGLADRVLRVRLERDRAEQARLRSERALAGYRQLVEKDALTGLASRRSLESTLRGWDDDAVAGAALFIDIDHFKQLNDTLGHAAGDDVLRAVAASLHDCLPADAHVARYGGEELVALLPGLDAASAFERAERVRREVATRVLAADGRAITVSVGVAQRAPAEPMAATLGRADAAMYRAKAAGRDRVMLG